MRTSVRAAFTTTRTLRIQSLGSDLLHGPKTSPGLVLRCSKHVPNSAQIHQYAVRERSKKPAPERQRRKLPSYEPKLNDSTTDPSKFKEACKAHNISLLADIYPAFVASGAATSFHTRILTQCLFDVLRIKYDFRPEKAAETMALVRQVTADIQTRRLAPHPFSQGHLMRIYTETGLVAEGFSFWSWLAQQDDDVVSVQVYAEGLLFLRSSGLSGLSRLEQLYLEGLQRYAGPFGDYHLSNDAIVPDRTQAVAIPDLPLVLLNSIVDCRVSLGDWRQAYLGLNTMLRVQPETFPPNVFKSFVESRPLNEAYALFMLASRLGQPATSSLCDSLLKRVRFAFHASQSLGDRMQLLLAAANIAYAHLNTAKPGQVQPIRHLFHLFETLFPASLQHNENKQDIMIHRRVVETAYGFLTDLTRPGMPVSEHYWAAFLRLAGRLQSKDLFLLALERVATERSRTSAVVLAALQGAGKLKDKTLIESLWNDLATQLTSAGEQVGAEHWRQLAEACQDTQHISFLHEQKAHLSHALTDDINRDLDWRLELGHQSSHGPAFEVMDVKICESELQAVKTQLQNIAAINMSMQRLQISRSPYQMHLDRKQQALAPESDLRALYDEVSIDPHQPPAAEDSVQRPSVHIGKTGIPIDELRFLNWISIFELMDMADRTATKVPLHEPMSLPLLRRRYQVLRTTRAS